MRQRPRRADPQRAADRSRADAACQHELADGQSAAGLQVVEAAAQPQRAGLRVQRGSRVDPAHRRRARHFGHEFVAQRAQPPDVQRARRAPGVGKGDVDALGGQRGRDHARVARGNPHDDANDALVGVHMCDRVHAQQLLGQRGDLVGRHHPAAHEQQQCQLRGDRGRAQAPRRDRSHSHRRVEHDVSGIDLLLGVRIDEPVRRRVRGAGRAL